MTDTMQMTYRHLIARSVEDAIEHATDKGRERWTDDYDDTVSELLAKIAAAIDSIPEVRMVLERPLPQQQDKGRIAFGPNAPKWMRDTIREILPEAEEITREAMLNVIPFGNKPDADYALAHVVEEQCAIIHRVAWHDPEVAGALERINEALALVLIP